MKRERTTRFGGRESSRLPGGPNSGDILEKRAASLDYPGEGQGRSCANVSTMGGKPQRTNKNT